MNNTINLGEIPMAEEGIALPLTADSTGAWEFITNFNGAYQYVQFNATAGDKLVVPAKLNEYYTYRFKLYKPDASLLNDTAYQVHTIPILPGVEYTGGIGEATIKAGKLQFYALAGQQTYVHDALIYAKQIAVFVEGIILQEGIAPDEYQVDLVTGTITFNTQLIATQKISILYIK
ncbi:hypothetical protein CAP35_12890 [Chitinophagaceae bacterium IBVUCB1]|nr:hypothetical protein CAP35_12890 [Chitinophagaceae bacterium IBVUCB1]